MSLVFYYTPQSNSTPISWTLEELGIPYEKVKLDLQAGQQRQAEFLKVNPNGKGPAITHDGTAIFESVAIQLYLGETFGVEKGLFPAPGPRRGEAMKWLVWCNVSLGEAVSRYLKSSSPRIPAEQHNAKAAEAAKGEIERLLTILDSAMEGHQYLVGDSFSLVDVQLVSWLTYLVMFGIDLKPYANFAGWVSRCTERPAFKRAE